MGNFEGDHWRRNLGLRIVRTEQTTNGAVLAGGPGSIDNPFGRFIPTTAERNYTDTLPSLNVAYDVRKDVVVRFAAAKVMARPDYTDIVPRTTLNPGALTGAAGNPNLDPYRASQEDLSIEWYPDSGEPVAGDAMNAYIETGFCENKRLSARLAYAYPSDFFVTFDRSTHLDQSALKSLDASVALNITDNIALTFDGLNLTDEKIVQFADNRSRPRAIYDNGRVYYAGAKLRF